MVASPAAIAAGRQAAATDVLNDKALCTAVTSVENKQMHGFDVTFYYDQLDGDEKSKILKAMDEAFQILHANTYHNNINVGIDIYLTDRPHVRNIAHVGNAAGGQSITIFLGPRVHHRQRAMRNPPIQVEGGITAGNRARGIADHSYDGTTVWFGNPKQVAMTAAVIIHEMGHVLHEFSSPGIFWDLKVDASAQPYAALVGWPAQALAVSQYATTNALEFVAETFTGMMLGKTYAPVVIAAYGALGGP